MGKEKLFRKIIKDTLCIDINESFQEVSIQAIKEALEKAYNAGARSEQIIIENQEDKELIKNIGEHLKHCGEKCKQWGTVDDGHSYMSDFLLDFPSNLEPVDIALKLEKQGVIELSHNKKEKLSYLDKFWLTPKGKRLIKSVDFSSLI